MHVSIYLYIGKTKTSTPLIHFQKLLLFQSLDFPSKEFGNQAKLYPKEKNRNFKAYHEVVKFRAVPFLKASIHAAAFSAYFFKKARQFWRRSNLRKQLPFTITRVTAVFLGDIRHKKEQVYKL